MKHLFSLVLRMRPVGPVSDWTPCARAGVRARGYCDRSETGPTGRHAGQVAERLPFRPEARGFRYAAHLLRSQVAGLGVGPVSYTHLTLPTIYSV